MCLAAISWDSTIENVSSTCLHSWWEYKLVQPLKKTIWWFFKKKKLKIELPYDPAILLLGMYPEKKKTPI